MPNKEPPGRLSNEVAAATGPARQLHHHLMTGAPLAESGCRKRICARRTRSRSNKLAQDGNEESYAESTTSMPPLWDHSAGEQLSETPLEQSQHLDAKEMICEAEQKGDSDEWTGSEEGSPLAPEIVLVAAQKSGMRMIGVTALQLDAKVAQLRTRFAAFGHMCDTGDGSA